MVWLMVVKVIIIVICKVTACKVTVVEPGNKILNENAKIILYCKHRLLTGTKGLLGSASQLVSHLSN